MAAQHAFGFDDWETTISRACYAVYHAVIALIESKTDLEIPRRHPQLHNLLRSPVFPPLLDREDIEALSFLYIKRQAADYRDEIPVREMATDNLNLARQLVTKIEKMMVDA